MSVNRILVAALAAFAPLGAACDSTGKPASELVAEPQPFHAHACEVCGMIVREQPAPRGQVFHRDGTRVFLCSLGDLRAHLEVRSSHGAPVGTWVEALPPDFTLDAAPTDPFPWVPAERASYVVGFERPRVMGRPVLSFATAADAASAARTHSARSVPWSALRETPSHLVPAGTANGEP